MDNNSFIITLTGPSQSGKSLVMKKIEQLGQYLNQEGICFKPQKIKKYTTRYLRLDEMKLLKHGEDADVEYVQEIPDSCDIVYQTYGVRYGIKTKTLIKKLNEGISPVIVVNDIRVVEEIKKYFSGKVLSLFLFRKIPELDDFKNEAKNRGNISEQEVVARYEKAVSIYRTYIENIILFDKVILNSIEYPEGSEHERNTIMDMQLENILLPIVKTQKKLRKKMEYPKSSRIFVIAGNAASGKDELVRALLSMGKLQAKVLPKYTMRQQEPEDGKEIICRFIPKESYLEEMYREYIKQKKEIEENIAKMEEGFKDEYREEFINFKQQLEKKTKNQYERFWTFITTEIKTNTERRDEVLKKYFSLNSAYKDLQDIKRTGIKKCEEQGVGIYIKDERQYIIYGRDNRLYGCDITDMQNDLNESKFHLVIVASEIGVVNVLKKEFGEDKVRLVYAHSEISASEFVANASDITKNEKETEFKKILDNYTKEISNYDHVTIYAKSQITYEQTSKEEELVDQMFRLLRAY